MIWVFLAVLPVLWARGTAACAHTLSGLIENLAGHPAGRGILHVRPALSRWAPADRMAS
jgi:hypothetical protein